MTANKKRSLSTVKSSTVRSSTVRTGLLSTLGCVLLSGYLPAWANEPPEQAEAIRLRNGIAEANGTTAGTQSLADMAGRDRRRKVCLGYAAAEPDHTLILTEPQPRLRIAISSENEDTTLLVLGPRGIDCNDNHTRDSRDAAVTARNWPVGEYQIWVGSFKQGDRISYQLRIHNPNTQQSRRSSSTNGSIFNEPTINRED